MGLSSEAGRLLSQQFEQHQMQKRYHAIVRGWLTEAATLDYPLVEELDKIADKFARDDKGPQPAVTDYRGMATTEMPVATSKFPTTRYSWLSFCLKPGVSTSCDAILRTCAIRLLVTANTVICARTAVRPNTLAAIV